MYKLSFLFPGYISDIVRVSYYRAIFAVAQTNEDRIILIECINKKVYRVLAIYKIKKPI